MSRFILFKRDDVDPYFRRVLEPSDIPEGFRDRVRVDHEKIIIDQKRVFRKGSFFHFSHKQIDLGNPFSDGYLETPLGYVPIEKTMPVVWLNGELSIFNRIGHSLVHKVLTIDDPLFDDLLYFDHITRKVVGFREYYKEKLQC